MSALHAYQPTAHGSKEFSLTREAFDAIANVVRQESGIDLSENKIGLVKSRLQKRLRQLGLENFDAYVSLLRAEKTGEELSELIAAISTNVTKFNREAHHFDHFREQVARPMIDRLKQGEEVLIWSAGCSNGSEPYTLACIMLDMFPGVTNSRFRILATDIDKHTLKVGVAGSYQSDMISTLPGSMLSKHFTENEGRFQISDQARQLVTFKPLNLMNKWPMSKTYDTIFCRNVLIYFTGEVQERLFERFAERLKPNAFLYIGHSERVAGPAVNQLKSIGSTTYQKTNEHVT